MSWRSSWQQVPPDQWDELDHDICDLQPCVYKDVDGRPTMYASGRPANHVGGDGSIDTTGKYLNKDGSSSWPGASGLCDDGWTGPSLPGGYPHPEYMERSHGKPYEEVMADHAAKTEALRSRRDRAREVNASALPGPSEGGGGFPIDWPFPITAEEAQLERTQIEMADQMHRGMMPVGTAPIEDPSYRAEMRVIRRMHGGDHMVGAFFYDPDLAKFGNAFSPFVQASSFESANLALQRPFQDRYNPRYERQPTWAEWQEMADWDRPHEAMGGDEWVGAATGRQTASDVRAIDSVDRRALLATGIIAGLTTLLVLHNKHRWLEIVTAGVAGVALTWGMSATRGRG